MITNIVNSIAIIPDNITRSVYIQECSQLLNMSESVLIAEINKIRKRNWDKQKEQRDKNDYRASITTVANAVVDNDGRSNLSAMPIAPISRFDRFEKEILRYVVRYGNFPIYQKFETRKRKDGKSVIEEEILIEEGPGVTEFVHFDLDRDNITFTNELYRLMFEKAVEHLNDKDFNSAQFFLHFPDQRVSKLASDLLSDRYQLSNIHSKILGEEVGDKSSRLLEQNHLSSYVPRATTELKNAYLLKKIDEIKKELKSSKDDNYIELITQLQQLQEVKRILAKELGERIVLKY